MSQEYREDAPPIAVPFRQAALETGMATHSSVLAWRILWTEEPGGLQSVGSQKGPNLETDTSTSLSLRRADQSRMLRGSDRVPKNRPGG